MGDKWTLLIIRDLIAGPRRFVEIQRTLPGISTEQLRSRLNRMVADGLLTRQRYREVPPRVDYELTERSRELMPVIGALARWGYDWTWGAPRRGEEVNIGAIFRVAPGLLEPSRQSSGTVEFVVLGERGKDRPYRFTISGGRVDVSEHPDGDAADAMVTGSERAWVKALGPDRDPRELKFEGRRELADELLRGFVAAAERTDRQAA